MVNSIHTQIQFEVMDCQIILMFSKIVRAYLFFYKNRYMYMMKPSYHPAHIIQIEKNFFYYQIPLLTHQATSHLIKRHRNAR